MNKEVLTNEVKDSLRRLERMSCSDITSMSPKNLSRLACGFSNELLVRMIVAKGEEKEGEMNIFKSLKIAFRYWLNHLSPEEQSKYLTHGLCYNYPSYFGAISYDIESRLPLVPQEEKNDGDDEHLPDDKAATLEDLREQVEMVRNKKKGISLGLNQAQAALFGLSLANAFNFNYTNKKEELAPVLHKLFGWGESKIAKYLSTPCDKKKRDELADLFKDLCPLLYNTIKNWGERPHEETPEETP